MIIEIEMVAKLFCGEILDFLSETRKTSKMA